MRETFKNHRGELWINKVIKYFYTDIYPERFTNTSVEPLEKVQTSSVGNQPSQEDTKIIIINKERSKRRTIKTLRIIIVQMEGFLSETKRVENGREKVEKGKSKIKTS